MPRRSRPLSEFQRFMNLVAGKSPPRMGKATKRLFRKLGKEELKRDISLEQLQHIWGKAAGHFSRFSDRRVKEQELKIVSQHAGIKPTDKIASIGSGSAVFEAFIAKTMLSNGRMVCVDISPEMNKIAEQTMKRAGVKNVTIYTASATRIPLPQASQDKVILSQTPLISTIYWPQVLSECRRIIKPSVDARFIVSFAVSAREKIDEAMVTESLRAEGFEPLSRITHASVGKTKAVMIIAAPRLF